MAGGWLEHMVRMLKEPLRRMLGKSPVNYKELATILCNCEATINARPLTYISNSPDELIPLTPVMLLVNGNCAKFDFVSVSKKTLALAPQPRFQKREIRETSIITIMILKNFICLNFVYSKKNTPPQSFLSI